MDHLFQAEVLLHPVHVTSEDHKSGEHKSGQSKCDMFIEHLFGISEKSKKNFSIINFCTCSLHAYPDEPMLFNKLNVVIFYTVFIEMKRREENKYPFLG